LTHPNSDIPADFKQRVIDRAINELQNDCGPESRLKDYTSNTWYNF